MKLLVVLQNAYGNRGVPKRRAAWLRALWRSHTGKRLREMLPEGLVYVDNGAGLFWPDDADCYICNASPLWTTKATEGAPADPEHLKLMIGWLSPTHVLACGRIAQSALDELGIAYIEAPHPAWRALTKERTAAVRAEVAAALKGGE